MNRILLALLLAWSAHGWAANTYLNTSCAFNGVGATGPCAVSAGKAGAFNTGASIFWSTIGAGNTLYIARGTTTSNWAGIIVDAGVIIDDYTGDAPGTADTCPVWTRSGAQTFMMSITASTVTVNDLCVTGNASSALISTTGASTALNRVDASNNTGAGIGVRFNNGSSNGSITDSITSYIQDDGIGIGDTATGTFSVIRHRCHHVDLAGGQGDCIQVYDSASASLVVSGGWFTKETGFKQAIRSYSSGSLTIQDRPEITLTAAGAQGISAEGTGTFTVTSVYIKGTTGAPLIFAHTSGTTTISNCILDGGDYGLWSSHATGTATVSHCAIRGQAIAAAYHTTDGAGGTLTIRNSYLDAPVNIYDAHASATTVSDYNQFGPSLGTFRTNGVTNADLAAWVVASSQDTHSAAGITPGFLGGNAPATPRLFRLRPTSALLAKGQRIGFTRDYLDRPFGIFPSVGPFELSAGDPGPARTARP